METSSTKFKFSNTSVNSTSEGIDRISNLPDDILHNILSCLYIFDVVQLSVLSKKWYYICRTMPYLEFDVIGFGCERIRRPFVCSWVSAKKFEDYINWVFISERATNLVRFKLCSSNLFDNMAIFRWICATTARNVQELVLSFDVGEFALPFCVSTCESLRVLKLDLSEAILKLPSDLGFCQLKFLRLDNVELSDEHLTSCLFSKCPLLEKVKLADCSFGTMTMLDIASTSLLYVSIVNVSSSGDSYSSCTVKISCPNLKELKYVAPMAKDIVLENLFSIEVVRIYFIFNDPRFLIEELGMLVLKMINNFPLIAELRLGMICIWGLHTVVGDEVRNSMFMLNKLKSLKLDVGIDEDCMQGLILLLKHSPNLEFLNLWSDENDGWDENWKLHDPNESIVCLESHLKLIQLSGFKCEDNEMELLRFFLKNALVLEKLIIVCDCYGKSEEATEVVLNYPRASSHVVVTFLDFIPYRKLN